MNDLVTDFQPELSTELRVNSGWSFEASGVPGFTIDPELSGISETMLWSLHNRASEALRPDTILVDPESIRIHRALDYDFTRHFGVPGGSLAARAAEIDRVLRVWLDAHPDGMVVSLGEGLESQRCRVDNGRVRWLSVDLPEAIRIRELFYAPTDRFQHLSVSVLNPVWMDRFDPTNGLFVIAQGLLMYLEPEKVGDIFREIANRFVAAEIVFDTVPRWFSQLTLSGHKQTPHYVLPAMPWGIDRHEIKTTLARWHPGLMDVNFLSYLAPRGFHRHLAQFASHLPVIRHAMPSLVQITMQ